ncbi:MAG: hypothetical protein IJO43_01560 [Bacilli bacterium]|nr:hypothetical protein [Bacilli bacterium]
MDNYNKLEIDRIDGWLDLDSYFIKRLGRPFRDEEDLFANGLIDVENAGRSDKFWVLDEEGNRIALFKEPINRDSDEVYAELIQEEICNILDISTAHYDLAKFKGAKGVISYSFLTDYDTYYSGFDLIANFYESRLEHDPELCELYGIDYESDTIDDVTRKLNNLEDIWCILEEVYKGHPNKQEIVSSVMDGLIGKLIKDVVAVDIDGHADNWGMMNAGFAPLFDGSRILNLHKNVLIEPFITTETIEDKELLFTVDNSDVKKPLEVLERFLNISSSEYRDLVREKVDTLKAHLEDISVSIEIRTEHQMPDYLKRYFVTTMSEHLDNISAIVDGKNKKNK